MTHRRGRHIITGTEPVPLAGDRSFFGHPRGLFFLAFTEAWERFSFYGMTALLVLYMVNQLLLPGHVENIAGFAAFRSALESLTGPLSPVALASLMFGLYSGFVYFTPVFGGLIADRWIGQRTAVVIGALSMSAGHIAMAFERTFLLALLLLVIGSGFLKGNISTQVGALYQDDSLRTGGFANLQHGDQFWLRLRAVGVRLSSPVLRLALWLWRRRDPYARRACNLPLRLSISACKSRSAQPNQRTAYPHRLARYRCADRRRPDHGIPVHQLLPALQYVQGLDPGTCRSQGWWL
jgi:hypothetical protein